MSFPQPTNDRNSFTTKLQAYKALYSFNRSIEIALERLEYMERIGLLGQEHFYEFRTRIEHSRAETNEALIERLQQIELQDSARFDRILVDLEQQTKDPDDVFFSARDRKKEIKQQIQELEAILKRVNSRPSAKSER
jgi:hypothetical protein